MRTRAACLQCRERKVRCPNTAIARACSRCLTKGRECSYASPSTTASRLLPFTTPLAVSKKASHGSLLPTTELSITLVDHYLHFLHDRPHSLFHGPSLKQAVIEGTVDDALLLALCALGCRFVRDEEVRGLGKQYFEESVSRLQGQMESHDIQKVQTFILLANICSADSKPTSEAMYFAMAIRMAQILRLNVPLSTDCAIAREVKKRVFLSLFMADRWYSVGVAVRMQLKDEDLPAEPAIDEAFFQADNVIAPHPVTHCTQGLWAYKIEIVTIFGHIQTFLTDTVHGRMLHHEVDAEAIILGQALSAWEEGLPESVKSTLPNIDAYRARHQGATFIDLHLGYHHYATILFFQFLGRQNPEELEHHPLAQRCREHALEYSRLLGLSRSVPNCRALHVTIGHMTVVSSSVLLYYLLSGTNEEIQASRAALTSNFEILIDLQTYWPGLTKWIKRLFLFQATCQCWPVSKTYEMGDWILRLILEHALPLDQKQDNASAEMVIVSPSSTQVDQDELMSMLL